MKRFATVALVAAALPLTMLVAQTPSTTPEVNPATPAAENQPAASATAQAENVEAVLDKSVDAKKNKTGDQVVATTRSAFKSGNDMVPKGSKLIGHITEAKPHSKDQPDSELGIAFDKAVPKHGQQVTLHAAIQGLFNPQPPMMESGGMPAGPSSQPGMAAPGSPAGPGTSPSPEGRSGGVAQSEITPLHTPGDAREGRPGANASIPGISLKPASGDSAEGSLITSNTRTVHLDSGTHMMLKVFVPNR